MFLRKFLSWCYKNADDRREFRLRDRMLKIHNMDLTLNEAHPILEFVASKPYEFSRVETINVLPKPLVF